MHTQGGTARVKAGTPVDGYTVPTVDYAGPKDLRPPLLLWILSDARLIAGWINFFQHTRASRSAKASVTRAVTRLCERRLIVLAPLPKQSYTDRKLAWGYVLTAEGLKAAGDTPLDVPMLAEALELFGVTHATHDGWYPIGDARYERKPQLVAALNANGYRGCRPATGVTVDATATDRPALPRGNRRNGYPSAGAPMR